ncbi:protein translocase subunit SecE [Candidatus Phytoplasma solani]|uniref:preprotein translocase subunit SecE n=1 Tax=Candidatus Phytoplasma solani TaxID=69896 RepID=UPI0032DB5523
MGIKVVNENKPNQLLGIIHKHYSFLSVFLLLISILFLGICGELFQSKMMLFTSNSDIDLILRVVLLIFFVVVFFVSSFRFFKDAFLQISQISFPSFKQIFFNTLQVIFFTFFLIISIWFFGYIINKLLEIKKLVISK